jgi:translation initiation factor 2 alpha subunit (eIF-2alpha)
MAKQFSRLSVESIQKQLESSTAPTEGNLNELLERLETEKVNLPVEDHPVIEWGIRVAKARIIEQEEYRKKMLSELEDRYNNGYEHFIQIVGWNFMTTQQKWLDECKREDLVPIVLETAKAEQPEKSGEFARKLRKYIGLYCQEPEAVVTFNGAIRYCISILKKMKEQSYGVDLIPYIDKTIAGLENG